MQPPNGSHREGFQLVTLPEASRILGVSESTVRRMVKAGKLEADRVERSQGHLWLVKLPAPSGIGSDHPPTVATAEGSNPPGAEALTAWSAAILTPIMARMAEQETTIRDQAETIGTLRAELDAERRAHSPVAGQETPEPPDPAPEPPSPFPWPLPPTPNVRAVTPWLLAVLAIVAVIVLLLVWLR
jgi:excisionase family DNA binding protein